MKILGVPFAIIFVFMMVSPAPDPQTITAPQNVEAANQAMVVVGLALLSGLAALVAPFFE